jgi:cytoskeletal protein RodZ
VHEDPTRMMGQPEDRGPDGHKPHGNMRLLVACLVAVIVGLVVAVIVIAGNDDRGSSTASSPESVTTLPSTAESTEATTTTEPTTTETTPTETTEPTTTTETTPTPTETTPTTTPEENGSGGIPAP